MDRALHNRSGIQAATRERILKAARELNYTPNAAAQSLKLSRKLRIAAFLPKEIASFFDRVREGMKSAAANWAGVHVSLTLHEFPHLGSGDIECMKKADWQSYDGILVAPGAPEAIGELLETRSSQLPPVVYVTSEAQRTASLSSVAVDSAISGGIAADLLGRVLGTQGSVIAFTGDRRIHDHAAKLSGFASTLALHYPHLSLLPSIESHDRSADTYQAALALFQKHPAIQGIYITTADSLPVLRAARETGVLGRARIVTTDLSPDLAHMIENDFVLATIYQRPFVQGSIAVDLLCRYLIYKTQPESSVHLAPHILLRSNLPLFLDQIDLDPAKPLQRVERLVP